MRSFFTTLRGEEVEVIVDSISEDPETNGREIDWHLGETPRPIETTPEEDERIESEAFECYNRESFDPEFD